MLGRGMGGIGRANSVEGVSMKNRVKSQQCCGGMREKGNEPQK